MTEPIKQPAGESVKKNILDGVILPTWPLLTFVLRVENEGYQVFSVARENLRKADDGD